MMGPGGASPGLPGVPTVPGRGVGPGVGVSRPPPGMPPGVAPTSGAPLVNVMRPQLSEFVIGSFHSLRSVRGRTSYISFSCLLYTSDAADEEDSVDLGGRR